MAEKIEFVFLFVVITLYIKKL